MIDRVGSGAFGVVYRCQDLALDRVVAIKVLLAAAAATPEAVERFHREARATARLSHPHIVPVFDAGIDSGRPYLVMEYVEGQPLDRLIGSPRLTIESTLRVVFHLAQALQAAHDQGVVHRDVKPANVLIDRSGRPKLVDFGLARAAADPGQLSRSGDLVGTPRYMSPEQALLPPDEVDHRTDVYSLGAVMYEMLTGLPAVDGATALAVLRRVTDEEPVPIPEHNSSVPGEVVAICTRMMEKDRDARYPTAGAVADALQAYILGKMFGTPEVELLAGLPPALSGAVPGRRSRRFWGMIGAAGVVLVLVGFSAARLAFPPARPVPIEPADPPPPEGVRDLSAARAELARLSKIADDRGYRERVAELLDDLNAAVKQFPADPAVRVLRGRLLRRAGEYTAAVVDFDKAGGPADIPLRLERALARYQWEVLYLGSMPEPGLRPPPSAELRADLEKLAGDPDPPVRSFGRLGVALTAGRLEDALAAVAARPAQLPDELRADLSMLEADALTRAAMAAHDEGQAADEDKKAEQRKRRDDLDARSAQAVRRGLEADPHHPGLLFLKASGWHRRVAWEAADGEDRDQIVKRHRPAFDAAYQRFRTGFPRVGVEAAAGRAVLLANYSREDQALDQLNEAAGRRPVLPPVVAFRVWLQLHAPPDGELSAEYAGVVLQQLGPAFETPPEEFSLYFVRALTHAALGKWDDARRDLLDGKKAYHGPDWPPASGAYANWCQLAATGPPVKFLDATIDLLWGLATPADLRIRLQDELFKRLTGPDPASRDGMSPDDVKAMTGWGHFRMAKFWAEKDDRANVLKHTRAALESRLADLTPKNFREDDAVKAWNTDEEFVKLYAGFEMK